MKKSNETTRANTGTAAITPIEMFTIPKTPIVVNNLSQLKKSLAVNRNPLWSITNRARPLFTFRFTAFVYIFCFISPNSCLFYCKLLNIYFLMKRTFRNYLIFPNSRFAEKRQFSADVPSDWNFSQSYYF